MSAAKILVLEDEAAIRGVIVFHLQRAGYITAEAETCEQARIALASQSFDLALVDWMLPDMSGLEFTRFLRRDDNFKDMAIIMLTARGTESDKVAGLEGGADDYVVKPFAARELMARLEAVLRRTQGSTDKQIQMGVLRIDPAGHRVYVEDSELSLGPTEYRLLKYLMTHPERVFSRSQLLDRVWGANVYVEERTVDVHIRRLRKALDITSAAAMIQTVRGAGYRMSARTDGAS